MSSAADVIQLRDSFGEKILKTVEFRGEQTVVVELGSLHEVLAKCRNDLGYEMVLDVSSLDHFGEDPRFEMVYELATVNDSKHLRVKAKVSEDEKVPSATDLWAGADWHEREVFDLSGIWFTGHPDLRLRGVLCAVVEDGEGNGLRPVRHPEPALAEKFPKK